MKKKFVLYMLLILVSSWTYGQTSGTVYKEVYRNDSVCSPIELYRADLADINSLLNRKQELKDLVKISDERIANYIDQGAKQDSIINKQGEILEIAQGNLTDATNEIKSQRKKKRRWILTSAGLLAVLVAENWILVVSR